MQEPIVKLANPKLEALASALAELSFNFDFTRPPTHDLIGIKTHRKTTSQEETLTGRQRHRKTISQEIGLIGR